MRVRIYQMDNIEENKNHFMGYDFAMKHGGIDESRYKNVFYGDIEANNLEDIYEKLNVGNKPPTYMGYSLSVSDVIEVIEGADDNLNGKTFFCDDVGYKTIDFDTSKCQPMEGKRCIYITPGNKPLDIKLNINEYDVLNNAVGGLIELTHPFDDEVCVVGNDEAKLIGMKGNRHIGESIYAGPILIVGDDGSEDFAELTKEQADKYMEMFAEPEQISDEEVKSDMGIRFIGFNY